MTDRIEYPDLRNEVISALGSLSDPAHQRARWGQVEVDVSYYDDLTLNVHVLYDDMRVLPSPEDAVPSLLHAAEVLPLRAVDSALGPLIRELGDSSDEAYLADPRWPHVVEAAKAALAVMRACDEKAG